MPLRGSNAPVRWWWRSPALALLKILVRFVTRGDHRARQSAGEFENWRAGLNFRIGSGNAMLRIALNWLSVV